MASHDSIEKLTPNYEVNEPQGSTEKKSNKRGRKGRSPVSCHLTPKSTWCGSHSPVLSNTQADKSAVTGERHSVRSGS